MYQVYFVPIFNPIAIMGGGGFHQQNSILNFTNLVNISKLEFGQNMKLSMPDHIILHWMHLLYIYKSYSQNNFFSTYYYPGGYKSTNTKKSLFLLTGGAFPPTLVTLFLSTGGEIRLG